MLSKSVVIVLCLLACLSSRGAYAQNQLVLLKGQKVILRLYPGDDIELKIRGNEDRVYSYVNNLFDTALLAHETLIPFSKIDRIYFVRTNFMNRVGAGLMIGGIGYFLIDQLNTVVVHGEDISFDEGVTRTSVAMVGVGIPMMMIKKKSQRMKSGYRLLTVKPGSPFYKQDVNYFRY